MTWQTQMTTILRYLIGDVDSTAYKYADDRLETTLLVAAQINVMNIDFTNIYTIDISGGTLTPDPTDTDSKDDPFLVLTPLKAACIIVSNEIKIASGNSVMAKDATSTIDLRGVTQSLSTLYKDLNTSFEEALLQYRAGNSIAGTSILGPYSPGSYLIQRNFSDQRSDGYFNNSF